MATSLTDRVYQFLKANAEVRHSAREISQWIVENDPDFVREKQLRSSATVIPIDTTSAVEQQIVAEIGSQRLRLQKKFPNIKTTESRPRLYYYTDSSDSAEINVAEREGNNDNLTEIKLSEADLYPLLSEYLWSELSVRSKRIDEKRSSNKRGPGGNRWLFPDLVGVEDLSKDWHPETKAIVQQMSDKQTKIWSFEVKIKINSSNLREVFFQAVSNSTWANFGYLAASEIEGNEKENVMERGKTVYGRKEESMEKG